MVEKEIMSNQKCQQLYTHKPNNINTHTSTATSIRGNQMFHVLKTIFLVPL